MQVYFKDRKLLDMKVSQFNKDGIDKLHVVSDFDRTLTKAYNNEGKIPSSWALLRQRDYFPGEYKQKANALFEKYHPIEIDENLDYEYRYNKMLEWWQSHRNLLVSSGLSRDVIEDIVQRSEKILRKCASQFLDFLREHDIPILIFSAGIGNIIQVYLESLGKMSGNVHILSNFFAFGPDGYATGYKDEIIHVMNKSESRIDDRYSRMISSRYNVILLGDSIGDAGMADNMKARNVIRIGFMNGGGNLDSYMENFDVVIGGDGSFDYVNRLMNSLCFATR